MSKCGSHFEWTASLPLVLCKFKRSSWGSTYTRYPFTSNDRKKRLERRQWMWGQRLMCVKCDVPNWLSHCSTLCLPFALNQSPNEYPEPNQSFVRKTIKNGRRRAIFSSFLEEKNWISDTNASTSQTYSFAKENLIFSNLLALKCEHIFAVPWRICAETSECVHVTTHTHTASSLHSTHSNRKFEFTSAFFCVFASSLRCLFHSALRLGQYVTVERHQGYAICCWKSWTMNLLHSEFAMFSNIRRCCFVLPRKCSSGVPWIHGRCEYTMYTLHCAHSAHTQYNSYLHCAVLFAQIHLEFWIANSAILFCIAVAAAAGSEWE